MSQGASVEYLEYEAYRPMADRKLEEIGGNREERWHVREVSIVHRIGRVEPGEASVAIVVASPRRGGGLRGQPVRDREDQAGSAHLEARGGRTDIWVGSQIGTRVDPP